MVHVIYIVKLLVLYIFGGLLVATATSGLGPFWHVAAWWTEPIVYEKLILWTVLLETPRRSPARGGRSPATSSR